MIQLDQYRIFASVAKNKSFVKAAEELYITQPAVSQSIKQLENEFGICLFSRSPKGTSLTEAGEALYAYVEQALSILDGAEDKINGIKNLSTGTLAIGASDTLCEHYLLPYLQSFHEKFSGINIRITNRTSRETVSLLNEGNVDIGFVNLPCPTSETVEEKKLATLNTCFVCNPKFYPSLCDHNVSADELSDIPILMLERESAMRRHTDAHLKALGIILKPQTELGSHDLLLSFAEIGLGVATVVREYSEKYFEQGTLVEINTDFQMPQHQIALIMRKKIPLTAAAHEFVKMLSTGIKE